MPLNTLTYLLFKTFRKERQIEKCKKQKNEKNVSSNGNQHFSIIEENSRKEREIEKFLVFENYLSAFFNYIYKTFFFQPTPRLTKGLKQASEVLPGGVFETLNRTRSPSWVVCVESKECSFQQEIKK